VHARPLQRAIAAARAVLGLGAVVVLGAGCGFDGGSARSTMPPLPPPVGGALITVAPVPATQTPTATTLAPGESVPADDGNPLSVAQRFLAAAANGDTATGDPLRIADRDPDVFTWATDTYSSTVAVAGDAAWGAPACGEPAGSVVTCTWLANDPTTSLVLTLDGAAWKVSHPLLVPAGDGVAPTGTACVVGDSDVRLRGGPGTNWPRFDMVPARTCGVDIFASVLEGPDGPWRLVRYQGTLGWMVDRVLRA